MKAVVIGESSGVSMEVIMSVYPRHKVIRDENTQTCRFHVAFEIKIILK